MNEVTIVIITYRSEKIIYNFLNKIPSTIRTIIIENSSSYELKKNIEEKYKNVSLFLKKNDGVSSALNYAVDKIKTKYFLQISPDIIFDFKDLEIYVNFAKEKNDKFAAIGPRFLNVKERSHRQIDERLESGKIDSIHGSCMFINKKSYIDIGKFDESFFLYFEETDYCFRAKKKGYFSYQINKSKVVSKGRTVNIDNENFSNVLIWHFIWSKYYFNKKKFGNVLSIIVFLPILIRTLFKIKLYKIMGNIRLLKKYKARLDGLLSSIKGAKSSLRP
ncbi:glycosyltransferase [Candidatus Pelagibacter sp.]|nr:glycosyltransferase [Candidatus Pelagibacter sp.]